MTEKTQEQEVKAQTACCEDQCECNQDTQAPEGDAQLTTEETPEQKIEMLQTALKLSEAKVMEHYDLYVLSLIHI